MDAPPSNMRLRHSLAPRVIDNTLPMRSLASHDRFSVRVQPAKTAASASSRSAPILATFIWRDPGARVHVAGSFDDWRKHQMTYVAAVGYHVLVVELPPGGYFYRFVVDGRWRVSEDDEGLREDGFGEWSHFLEVCEEALEGTKSRRFSSVALAKVDIPGEAEVEELGGDSESESEEEGEEEMFGQMAPERLTRHAGEEYIGDYGDDEFGELDLQADVYEAMYDCKEEISVEEGRKLTLQPAVEVVEKRERARRARQQMTNRSFKNVFAKLFGRSVSDDGGSDDDPPTQYKNIHLASPDVLRQVEEGSSAKRRGGGRLRVWFAGDRRRARTAQRAAAADTPTTPVPAAGTEMRVHQAEENAVSRQELGKALFAQGRYDAALAMFSLSVKIREDNGLKNAKSSAVAHTDVASAFIHLSDLNNAQKHLDIVLAIYAKKTFSGGRRELADCHCFIAVVAEMRGDAVDAEASYRKTIDLYEAAGATKGNQNYETACENLKDNLRRQREGNTLPAQVHGQQHAQPPSSPRKPKAKVIKQYTSKLENACDDSTVSPYHSSAGSYEKENEGVAAVYNPTPRSQIKSILRNNPDIKPIIGPTPHTIDSVNSFPDTMESYESRQNQEHHLQQQQHQHQGQRAQPPAHFGPLDPSALKGQSPDSIDLPPVLDEFREQQQGLDVYVPEDGGAAGQRSSQRSSQRRSSRRRSSGRPTTWKALADVARASMPLVPMDESESGVDEDESNLGTYEEMSRGWHKDGRELLLQSQFAEAIDMYTLAIYTRKRHGPWNSRANAETHVEYARALFATKDVITAASTLRDAIMILEKMGDKKHDLLLGQVWGNLGSALDRLGGRPRDAELAHSTGLVAYIRAGLAKDDEKWKKAWRNLCVNNKAQGKTGRAIEEVWHSIDQQTRGVVPMTSAASLKI